MGKEALLEYIGMAPNWWCVALTCLVMACMWVAAWWAFIWLSMEIVLPCLKWVGNSIVWLLTTIFNPHVWAWAFIGLCVISVTAMGGTITMKEEWWKT